MIKLRPNILPLLLGLSLTLLPAQAQIPQTTLTLAAQTGETYSEFRERAWRLARQTLERRFQEDPDLSQLRLVVVGYRQGATAPALAVTLSQSQWRHYQKTGDLTPYLTDYPDSAALLNFPLQFPAPPEPNGV
ncbi:MAG: hypothetical protein GC158_09885 [Cyanobacteria bacterium RI_101]|nr:hypothetical protein [Cyanobacteria bacterium RI_101]